MITDLNLDIGILGKLMKDKKNILILGSSGMLGSEVLKIFLEYNKFNISSNLRNLESKKKFKITNLKKVNFFKFNAALDNINILKKYVKKNTIIINCIGIIKPHINESSQDSIFNAILVNSIFPYKLNKIFKKNKIFQIATDCVFSGKKKLYTENSLHDAEDVYGKSKSLGEINNKNFFNIRTSIIGKELDTSLSLFEWFVSQPKDSKLNGFKNHLWNGITTKAFAKVLISIIENKIKIPNNIHVMPQNIISKFQMLKLFKEICKKEIMIKGVNAKIKVNRTLSTNYPKLVKKIWKGTSYKKVPKIEEIILDI